WKSFNKTAGYAHQVAHMGNLVSIHNPLKTKGFYNLLKMLTPMRNRGSCAGARQSTLLAGDKFSVKMGHRHGPRWGPGRWGRQAYTIPREQLRHAPLASSLSRLPAPWHA